MYDYDLNAKSGAAIIRFPKRENLFAVYDSGDSMLLLTRRFRHTDFFSTNTRYLFSINTIKGGIPLSILIRKQARKKGFNAG